MNTKTITIQKTIKRFTALTPKQQDKVLENLSDINLMHGWEQDIFDYYKRKLQKLGFINIRFEYSGFWSQGDGPCFGAMQRRGEIYKIGRYAHSHTMRCDESEALLKVARRIANQLYKSLQTDYEYLTSREAIIETIEANDYWFDNETLQITSDEE